MDMLRVKQVCFEKEPKQDKEYAHRQEAVMKSRDKPLRAS